jgi:2,3-bisphosphoglycerate-dependent phosphoglycerate mutase
MDTKPHGKMRESGATAAQIVRVRPVRFFLIRHAEAEIRVGGESVMCGWHDPPLTELGRRQTALLAERLAGISFHAAFTSTLRRAMETARALPPHAPPAQPLRSIREISCGALEGLPIVGVQRDYAELWRRNEAQADDAFRWPGGESYSRFRMRVLRGLHGIARRFPGGSVVVFTHAGVVSQVMGLIQGRGPAEWKRCLPRHTGITEVLWNHASPELVAFDDCDHLTRATPRRLAG